MNFRHPWESYTAESSKEYTSDVRNSHSMQLSYEVLKEFVNEETMLLEIGCGHGSVLEKVRDNHEGVKVLGLTNNFTEYEQLLNKDIEGAHFDMHLMPWTNKFDVVLCSHVFEHSPAPFVAAVEINAVLKLGGIVVIIVPGQENKWVYEDYHLIVPTQDHLINLFSKAGFEKVRAEIINYKGMEHQVYIGKKVKEWEKKKE